ncbi:hypothetical protein [Chromobacterium haemolyticum]|uniref:hypothetical protein n=1 Tax=Chromobacterium haemolyticum TaxID=394935 RepID=UPI001178BD15|nr:hypothetical protein [Chromobacterium haemolyticum]
MEVNITSFFDTLETENLLATSIKNLSLAKFKSQLEANIASNLAEALRIIKKNKTKIDELCHSNIKWIGDAYLRHLNNLSSHNGETDQTTLFEAFSFSYRFLREMELLQPEEASFELNKIFQFVDDNLNALPDIVKQQILFANFSMPAQILKRLIHDPKLKAFKDFETTVAESKKIKTEWDESIKDRENKIKDVEAKLSQITTKYNFVGLVHGFQDLQREKKKEAKSSFITLIFLSLALIAIPASELYLITSNIEKNITTLESLKSILIFTIPALITIELFTLYYFRIILTHFKSVKAQILQLDLRISLCQFIESYSSYASDIKKTDPSALGKFESIIFSNLVSEDTKIPATFDGIEQLANIAKAIKNK